MTLPASLIAELASFSTPSVLNGLKRLGHQPAQMQSMDRHRIHCMAPSLGARAGFAVTRKVATRRSGTAGSGLEGAPTAQQADAAILDSPSPRFLVVQNVGDFHGPVCIWGEVAANINLALGCVAGVTNGPVRDVPEMESVGFLTFADGVGTGGGYVDTLEFGGPVSVGGLQIQPGDLLHGDVHGVIKVPIALAPALPDAIRQHEQYERQIIEICQSKPFSIDELNAFLARRA